MIVFPFSFMAGTGSGPAPGPTTFENYYSNDFDGTNDYVDLGTELNSMFEIGDSFSVSAWVKFGNTATDRTIISNMTSGTKGFQLRVRPTESVRLVLAQTPSVWLNVDTSVLAIDTWHHIVATYDGSNATSGMNIYVNGSLDNDSTGGGGTISDMTSTDSVKIGKYTGGQFYAGNIDEVAIFDTVLPATGPGSVEEIYNGGVPADLTSLSPTAWWRMGDESGYQYLTNKMSYSKYSTYFDGIDDYVSGINSTQFVGASKISISIWAKYQGVNRFIISTEGSANDQFMINTWGTTLYWQVRNGSVTYGSFSFSGLMSAGDWFHLVCTFDGTQSTNADKVKMYFNGAPKTLSFSGTQPATISSSIGDIEIGRQSTFGSNYWLGNIDEVSIYSGVLDSSDVTDIYNNGKPKDESARSGLEYYFKMGENNVFPKIPNEIAYSKKSLLFDGVDDFISVPHSTSLDITGAISISAWVKWDGGTQEMIVSKEGFPVSGDFKRGWALWAEGYGSDAGVTFIIWSSATSYTVDVGSNLTSGVWSHVVAVFEPSTSLKVYVNGSLVATNTTSIPATIDSTTAAVTIGRFTPAYSPGYNFGGNIDDVSVYSTDLSASDVTDIYNSGKPKDESARANLVGYWKMGDGDYFPTATDSSGNGNNGTIYNETGGEMIQLDTPNGWGTAENETAPEMIQGDTPKGNHGYMENMEQAAIKQDAPT